MKAHLMILALSLGSGSVWAQGTPPQLDCKDVALQYQILHEKKLAYEELEKLSNKSQRKDTLKAVIREAKESTDETLDYYEGAFEACQVEWNIQPKANQD